jgi:hypothetical protein
MFLGGSIGGGGGFGGGPPGGPPRPLGNLGPWDDDDEDDNDMPDWLLNAREPWLDL